MLKNILFARNINIYIDPDLSHALIEKSKTEQVENFINDIASGRDIVNHKIHYLKTVDPYFVDVWVGKKEFEYRTIYGYKTNPETGVEERYLERDINVGDFIVLQRYDAEDEVYGKEFVIINVGYILKDSPEFNLHADCAVIGFKKRDSFTCMFEIEDEY